MLESLNFNGIILGSASFIIIMVSRYSCIKGEYYFTKKIWLLFLVIGLLSVVLSFFISQMLLSGILSILGFSYLWGIQEVIEQEERVKKGWFPQNPKRKVKKVE